MKYEHIVYIEQKDNKSYLCVDRLFESGKRNFMTHLELTQNKVNTEDFALMEKSAEWLGNSLLIDNPQFRDIIGLNHESS